MHIHKMHQWQHAHQFHHDDDHGERRTRYVIALTALMMVAEIAAGLMFGSMALLADGWHMGTHAAALGITVFAYAYARRHANDPRFSFGTGKVSALGGFTSAVVLAVVALWMGLESIERLFVPVAIRYDEAIGVAVLGLAVNLFSAYLLGEHDHGHGDYEHTHAHTHDHDHDHHHHHHDHNLRAAYLHVLADALTSLLAIVALVTGKAFGWSWMDPVMGIVGAVVIARWSYGLLRETARVLLDGGAEAELIAGIRRRVEGDADNRVADLHIWQVGQGYLAAIISVVTHYPQAPAHYRALLADLPQLRHVTIEVNHCTDAPCLGAVA